MMSGGAVCARFVMFASRAIRSTVSYGRGACSGSGYGSVTVTTNVEPSDQAPLYWAPSGAETLMSESTYSLPPERRCAQMGRLLTERACCRHRPGSTARSNWITISSRAS